MRVYLPATAATLGALLTEGQAAFGPGFAVTPELREWYASGDTEELEYIAMELAAAASLRLLAAEPDVPRRRVVVAADIEPPAVTFAVTPIGGQRGRVTVQGAIARRLVAAIHVDGEDAAPAVTAALAQPDDEFAAEDAADHELLWYATQELEDLLKSL
jgi:hypothetical protein